MLVQEHKPYLVILTYRVILSPSEESRNPAHEILRFTPNDKI